jgi:hypothetical protein
MTSKQGAMDMSDEIKTVLLSILRIGLLRIRALGTEGSAQQCSVEADHLHNLPGLVQSPRPDQILYYYNVERTGFLRSTTSNTDEFKTQWEQLAKLIEATKAT